MWCYRIHAQRKFSKFVVSLKKMGRKPIKLLCSSVFYNLSYASWWVYTLVVINDSFIAKNCKTSVYPKIVKPFTYTSDVKECMKAL